MFLYRVLLADTNSASLRPPLFFEKNIKKTGAKFPFFRRGILALARAKLDSITLPEKREGDKIEF